LFIRILILFIQKDKVSEQEKEFCNSINIPQSLYLKLRNSLFKEGPRQIRRSTFKKKVRSDAHRAKRLYEFFVQKKWILPSPQKNSKGSL